MVAYVPKTMANILKGETLEAVSLQIRNKKDTTYHHSFLTFSVEDLASN